MLAHPATALPKLHKLIQPAMGGEDAHMHGFAKPLKKERRQRVPDSHRFEKSQAFGLGERAHSEARFKLNDLVRKTKDKLLCL